jgi:hypothetical protein
LLLKRNSNLKHAPRTGTRTSRRAFSQGPVALSQSKGRTRKGAALVAP